MDEHYHSIHGAIQESQHVFIDAGLKYFKRDPVKIFEVGFGTGLNAFLTCLEAINSKKTVIYHSIELFPLDIQLALKLNYPEQIFKESRTIFEKLHSTVWNTEEKITGNFSLLKIKADLTTFTFDKGYDLVFYDAFGPDKQPEVWGINILKKVYNALNKRGILTTYCAKGIVKRNLMQVGFEIESLPGPPGKREMIRATKS